MGLGYTPNFLRRRIKTSRSFCEDGYIPQIHNAFNRRALGTRTNLKIIDSHGAYPYYQEKQDSIIIDLHFFDILRIVSAIMATGKVHLMDYLADYCTADYFLCRDEVFLSHLYAVRFAEGKNEIKTILDENSTKLDQAFTRQSMFVLSHEQCHALLSYNLNDPRFKFSDYHFHSELLTQNAIASIIRAIDLTPIQDDLDEYREKYDPNESFDYSATDIAKTIRKALELGKIIEKGLLLSNVQKSDLISEEDALYHACDLYIKKGRISLLSVEQYREECLADGYTLERLVNWEISGETAYSRLCDTAFSYFTCLLAMNVITCVNSCVLNYRSEGYSAEDYVYNRMKLEREIFNHTMRKFGRKWANDDYMISDLFKYAEDLLSLFNSAYARFCERVYSVIHPSEDMPYFPVGSVAYEKMYTDICNCLSVEI